MSHNNCNDVIIGPIITSLRLSWLITLHPTPYTPITARALTLPAYLGSAKVSKRDLVYIEAQETYCRFKRDLLLRHTCTTKAYLRSSQGCHLSKETLCNSKRAQKETYYHWHTWGPLDLAHSFDAQQCGPVQQWLCCKQFSNVKYRCDPSYFHINCTTTLLRASQTRSALAQHSRSSLGI